MIHRSIDRMSAVSWSIAAKRGAIAAAFVILGASLASADADAMSTDGFHMNMILPVVVQTASFSSDIYLSAFGAGATVSVTYYPADGTATGSPVVCGNKVINAGATNRYTLLSLCPGIAAGSNYGSLELAEVDGTNNGYNVFARVDNPSGQGFEVEGYPAHTFTAADAYVVGLKRQAAAPGFQTNCFVAALGEPTTIDIALVDGNGNFLAAVPEQALAAREMRRFLDIFTAAGLPAGDYSNVTATFLENQVGSEPGAILFCTVQNNTTFDADFRIAKAHPVQDDHALRTLTESVDALGNVFTLGAFPNSRNRHVVNFKHPDTVACSIDRIDGGNVTDLEMQLVAPDGATVVAGGNATQSFPNTYLGAKSTRNNGANGRWFIDVEAATGGGVANGAQYAITCRSGSGHSHYEWVGRNLLVAF